MIAPLPLPLLLAAVAGPAQADELDPATRALRGRTTLAVGATLGALGAAAGTRTSLEAISALEAAKVDPERPVSTCTSAIVAVAVAAPLMGMSQLAWTTGSVGLIVGAGGALHTRAAVVSAGGRVSAAPAGLAVGLALAPLPLTFAAWAEESRPLAWAAAGTAVGSLGLLLWQDQLSRSAAAGLPGWSGSAAGSDAPARWVVPLARGRF